MTWYYNARRVDGALFIERSPLGCVEDTSLEQALAHIDSMNAVNPYLTYELVNSDVRHQRTFVFEEDYGRKKIKIKWDYKHNG